MIRNAVSSDWDDIMEIYAGAREFMKSSGNPTQWGDTFPPEDMVRDDIKFKRNFVLEIDGRIQAVFALISGEDPTYKVIANGGWLNDEPYYTVHRVASRGEVPRVTDTILSWCLKRCKNVRIDTHDDNIPMQKAIERNGFTRCGRIWVEDGSPRIAYQKIV